MLGVINRYARRSNLVGVAGLFGNDGVGWHMTAMKVVNGQPVPTLLGPASAKGADDNKYTVILLNRGPAAPIAKAGSTSPVSISPDNYTPFDNVIQTNPFIFDEAENKKQLAEFPAVAAALLPKVYNIINPALHDVTETDCGSCHLASKDLMISHDRGVLPTDLSQIFKTTWNISNIASGPALPLNDSLHMFSFFQGQDGPKPQVQARVITESAVAVDFVNLHYASALQAN